MALTPPNCDHMRASKFDFCSFLWFAPMLLMVLLQHQCKYTMIDFCICQHWPSLGTSPRMHCELVGQTDNTQGKRYIKQQGYEEWDESCKITFHPGRHLRLHFAHSLYVEGCYKVYLVGGPALLWR